MQGFDRVDLEKNFNGSKFGRHASIHHLCAIFELFS